MGLGAELTQYFLTGSLWIGGVYAPPKYELTNC